MRSVLAVAVVATLAFAAPGHGAVPKPQITDPTGDATPPISAGYDIVSALFRTEGTTVKVGKRKVYTPNKLVVTTTYAGDVPTDTTAAQILAFDAPGCTNVYLERYSAGAETYGVADCVDGSFEFNVKISGKTATFSLPFNTIGKAYLKPGALLTNLQTYTAGADPVLGYETAELGGDAGIGTIDNATTTAAYKIS